MRWGECKSVHLQYKEKKNLLGNIKLLQSVKFRFTFNHVYKHALINLKIKPTIF